MIITFSPIQSTSMTLNLTKSGDILIINGNELDLSVVPDGAEIPEDAARGLHPMIAGPIKRVDGDIHIGLRLPYADGDDPCVTFPEPLHVTDDGTVDLPFVSYSETEALKVEGGTNIVTTTYRWRQETEVSTEFVPNPQEGDDNGKD